MATKVRVTNISSQLSESQVRDLFECCGSIKSFVTAEDQNSRSCTIEFLEPAQARAACSLSGTPLGDKNIHVETAKSPLLPLPNQAMLSPAAPGLLPFPAGVTGVGPAQQIPTDPLQPLLVLQMAQRAQIANMMQTAMIPHGMNIGFNSTLASFKSPPFSQTSKSGLDLFPFPFPCTLHQHRIISLYCDAHCRIHSRSIIFRSADPFQRTIRVENITSAITDVISGSHLRTLPLMS